MLQHIVYKKNMFLRKLKIELKKLKRNKNKILKHFDDKNLHDLKKKYCYLMYTTEFPLQRLLGVIFIIFTEVHASEMYLATSSSWILYMNMQNEMKINLFLNAPICVPDALKTYLIIREHFNEFYISFKEGN